MKNNLTRRLIVNKVVLTWILLLMVNSSYGETTHQEEPLSIEERQQVAWALEVLAKYKVLTSNEVNCIEVKTNLIEKLQNEGLLKKGNTPMMSICIGSSN